MSPHPRRTSVRLPVPLVVLGPCALALVLLGSCAPDVFRVEVDAGISAEATFHARPGDPVPAGSRARVGHPWFPLTPGRYTDFRILRYPSSEATYVRATLGEPEEFFGRLATPFVYGPVPGRPLDESLDGLRQYYSVDEDGALRMHGAQNKGIMSYMEPPIRHLPPDPEPGAAWIDTTYFRSFFPGMIPIFDGPQSYASTLSERAFLDLPGTPAQALRRAQVIETLDDPANPAAGLAGVDGAELAAALLEGALPEIALGRAQGRRDRPVLVPEKGLWFARNQGIVARDYPHGPGPTNINITTYERIGSGFGPVPPPQPAP